MKPGLLTVLLFVVVAGCGREAVVDPGAQPPDPLRGGTFLATAMTEDGRSRALVPDTEVSVEFTEDGRLIARGGCNMMQGAVDTANGRLVVDGLSMTEMGCDPSRHDQDAFLADVLGAAPSWVLDDDRLTITAGGTVLTMAPREAVNPDRALTGTAWVLDTLVEGNGADGAASSLPAGVPPVTLVFDAGSVTAETNCNGVAATYTVTGDRLVFEPGASTLIGCAPEIAAVEAAVAKVLQGEVAFKITADRLTLTHPSGEGLHLHAN